MAEILGRDAESAVIRAFLDRAFERPRALVIDGVAGIGKSTLWLAAVAAARKRGFAVLCSRPAETERLLANVVLGDLFEGVNPDELAALPSPRRRAFESALLMRDDPGQPINSRALGVALVTLLSAIGGERPLLLAIDDDQWIDPSTAETLSFALRRLQGRGPSVLLSRRAEGGRTSPTVLEDAFEPAVVERLAVGPLSVGALHGIVRERLAAVFPRPAQVRIHEASGGNPFYALELARAQLAGQSGEDATPLAVPARLEALVDARLAALDVETRQGLLLLAAHGRFPVAALRSMAIPAQAVDRARRGGVIETADGVARFTHPLLASAIYQGAPDEDRRAAHRRLATMFDDPIHRARHLALGAETPDAKLAATIEAAATLARDRGVSIAAAELAEHALRLTSPDAVEDWRRRAAAAARAHSAAGDGTRAGTVAAELLAAAPGGRARAQALLLRSEFEALPAAVALLEEALAEAADGPELQAAIHAALAENGYFAVADREAFAESHARASLEIAEGLDDDALRANALSILALLQFNAGRAGALELAQRAHRLASARTDLQQLQRSDWVVGHILTWVGDVDRARDWLEARLVDWTDRDERARADFLWYLALVEFWAGRWGLAGDYAAQNLEILQQYGMESPFDFFPSALIALCKGELERARSLSERALALGGEAQALKSYHAILATADLWDGDAKAAIVNFGRAESFADSAGSQDPSMRHWVPDYIEALVQLSRIDEAAELTGDWEAAAHRLGRDRVIAQAVRCRGLVAAARGEVPAALELLEEAVRRHVDVGDPFGRARAELALGVNRRRARQKRSAREALEAARAGFEALGAATWAEAARSELGRIGGRTRIGGLSPSELSVAELVAAGRTNREIASTLFLGERTVASHLTHIYAKLGIRSRTELAREFASKVQTS